MPALDLTLKHLTVMIQSGCRVIERCAERAVRIVVDQLDGQFLDPKTHRHRLYPELHRKCVPIFGQRHVRYARNPECLEPAERVGEAQP